MVVLASVVASPSPMMLSRRGLVCRPPVTFITPAISIAGGSLRLRTGRRGRVVPAARKEGDDEPLAPSPRAGGPESEEDDPRPDDIDPELFEALGMSIDDFLSERSQQAKRDMRARTVGASVWGVLATVGFIALGGMRGYYTDLYVLTGGHAFESNTTFVWMLLLGYFSVKGAVMAAVASVRAFLFAQQQPEPDFKKSGAAAWWRWQECSWRRERAAAGAFVEFAVSFTVLGALVVAAGGADDVQLRIDTLDQGALCRLTVALWLFWECYLSGIAGMGAGGKAALTDMKLQKLLKRREAQEERRLARIERMRRVAG